MSCLSSDFCPSVFSHAVPAPLALSVCPKDARLLSAYFLPSSREACPQVLTSVARLLVIYVPRQRERWLHARGESPRTQCSVWHGIHLPQGLFSAGMSPSMPGFPFLPPEFHPAVKHSVWGSLFRCRRRLAGFSALTPRRSVSLPVRVCFYPSILLNGRDCSL